MELIISLLALILNPIVLIAIAVVIIVRHRKKSASQSNEQTQPAGQDIVADEFGALRLEEMARYSKAPAERSVLLRAAHALRNGLRDLPKSVALDGAVQSASSAPTAIANVAPGAKKPTKPVKPTKPAEPEIPLAERGLKALQNINILLYLGAFFLVVAAGVFIGSSYGSISDGMKVTLLGMFALVFYLVGLALYRFTDRIRPAGVTFTAIGLLVAPLVGVAAQSLLFVGKSPGPVWLVTSVALVLMQVVAFMVIRKSYIAYYAALTTISLFQALTNTLDAPVYWYGWMMLATAMVYLFVAKFWRNQEVGAPFGVVAQIFAPISVIVMLLGLEEFGLWAAGVHLVLVALFYFMSSALMDFDQSNEELAYISLAAFLFPIGFGIVLWARDLPHLAVAIMVMLLGALYCIAEKLVPTEKHKPIYATLASAIFVASPLLIISDPRQMSWLVFVAAVLHAAHYLLTRFRPAFTLFNVTILGLPILFGLFILENPLKSEQMAVVYLIGGVVMTLVNQFVLRPLQDDLVSEQDGFAIIGLTMAIVLAYISSQEAWLTAILLGSSAVFMSIALWRSPSMLTGVAVSLYLAVIDLAQWQDWSTLTGAWVFLAASGLVYACYRLLPPLRTQKQLSLILFGIGLFGTYMAALSIDSMVASLLLAVVGATIVALSFAEKLEDLILLAVVAFYGAALHLGAQQDWQVAPVLFVCSLAVYGAGLLSEDRRSNLARWTSLAGFGAALLTSFDGAVNKWLAVVIHLSAGGVVMAESYKMQHRAGKYIASAVVWAGTLRIYDAFEVNFSQLYIQTTAVYLAALAYRQYQRGARQPQDALTISALVVSTVPLALQALSDTTGGYILGILGLGLALTVFGMSVHYNLVRTWGIATLVVVVLYKTAGTIFSLPPEVWLGIIGVTTLVGAIYLLMRRPPSKPK